MLKINKNTILVIYFSVIFFLTYLAFKIFFGSPIPKYVVILIVFVILSSTLVFDKALKGLPNDTKNEEKTIEKTRGMVNRRRDDPIYDIIGGIGGFS